jgi:hypothetical protein
VSVDDQDDRFAHFFIGADFFRFLHAIIISPALFTNFVRSLMPPG